MKHGDKTRKRILEAGVELWPDISLSKVAAKAGLTHGAVIYHYPTCQLKDAIAEYAVKEGISRVIVQLISSKHPAISEMTEGERSAHFYSV